MCCILFSIINAHATLVVIVDGKKQELSTKILLNADYHEIVFHLPQNPQNTYQYYLENLENTYKNTIFSEIRYTNLDGGKYIFHSKVTIEDKVIENYAIEVEIRENFWEKWWFFGFLSLIVIFFISLLVYFWCLYDFRQRMKVEAIRQRIAADLHDEVGANLNSITFITELLRKQSKKDEKMDLLLDKITNNSMESATLINDTIWALNPNFDSFEKLIERIKSFASGLLSSKDIAFSVENNLTNKNLELSIEQRRNLYLIIKEAINNVAKHSQANKAFLRIKEANDGIKITIEDDGVGFDINVVCEGNGLKNYQIRAMDSDIEVRIESESKKGTKINVLLNHKNHQNM